MRLRRGMLTTGMAGLFAAGLAVHPAGGVTAASVGYEVVSTPGFDWIAASGDATRALVNPNAVVTLASGASVPLPANRQPLRLDRSGTHVLASVGDSELRIITVATGAESVVNTATGPGGDGLLVQPRDSAIGADGLTVVFPTWNPGTLRQSLWLTTGGQAPVDITAGLPSSQLNRAGRTPTISADGRYVVFAWSDFLAGCHVPGPDCLFEIVRYDIATGARMVVSLSPAGGEAAGVDTDPAVSADGRFVAWLTDAFDVAPGLTTRRTRVAIRDIATGTTRVLAEAADTNRYGAPVISDDGLRLAATLSGPVNVGGTPGVRTTARLVDLTDGTVVTLGPVGRLPDGPAAVLAMAPDGASLLVDDFGTGAVPGSFAHVRVTAPRTVTPAAPVYPPSPVGPPVPHGQPFQIDDVPGVAAGLVTSMSRDGRYVGALDGLSIPTGVYRIDVVTGAVVHVPHIGPATLSGDGRYLFTNNCRWDLETGAIVRDPLDGQCDEGTAAPSEDGSVVAGIPYLGSLNRAVRLWRPPAASVEFDVRTAARPFVRPWMSADGARLTVALAGSPCTVRCNEVVRYDLASGASRVLVAAADQVEVSSDGRYVAFVSDAAEVVPGLGAGQRAYRLDADTGVVVVVHDGPVTSVAVSDDGSVALTREGPITEDGGLTTGTRLALWRDGVEAFIDWAPDGAPPDVPTGAAAVVTYRLAADGKTVVIAGSSRNLVRGRTGLGLVVVHVDRPVPAGGVSAGSTPVVPERLLDTRSGVGYAGGKPAAGDTVALRVTGVGGTQVPADASAVVLNVTATEATADGYVTVWPCGSERPTASNLNVRRGQTVPNLVMVKVGAGGEVCLFTQSGTHLIADVAAWYPSGSSFTPVVPERLLDTRSGVGYSGGKPAAGDTITLAVTGIGATQVPTDARTVLLNVTATEATADGYVTVWPCGSERPVASNLNLVRGETAPNLVAVKLGTGGTVCLFTQQGAELIADVAGYER